MDYRNTLGQYIPAESPVHSLQPHTKLLLTAGLATAVFLAKDPLELALAAVILLFFTAFSRVPFAQYVRGLRPMIILVALAVVIQLFASQAVNLGTGGTFSFEGERSRQILFIGVKLLELCWIAQWLTVTTSPVRITRGLEILLEPGKKLGIPVQETAMMATVALRFLPVIMSEAQDIIKAQASRGADFESFRLRARLASLVSVLVPLVSRCWRRAEDLALSLEIRGYRAGGYRSHLPKSKMGFNDYVFLTVGFFLLLFVLIYGHGK